jgi:hypothetical protein
LKNLDIEENKILTNKLITIIENIIKILQKYYTFETVTDEGKQFKKILKKYGKNN